MDTPQAAESTQINVNQAVPEPVALDPLPMTMVVSTDKGPVVLAPHKGPGRPPRDPAEWTDAFLRYYAEWGNMHNAARFAGVDAKTARKYRRSSPEFDRAVRQARRAFIASMQEELVKQGRGLSRGSTIAVLARLKASGRKMAERYSEKAVDARVLNLTINQAAGAPPDVQATLARMWELPEDERRAMLGEVIAPPALPAGTGAAPAQIEDAEIVGETP